MKKYAWKLAYPKSGDYPNWPVLTQEGGLNLATLEVSVVSGTNYYEYERSLVKFDELSSYLFYKWYGRHCIYVIARTEAGDSDKKIAE